MSGLLVCTRRELNAAMSLSYGFGIGFGLLLSKVIPWWLAASVGIVSAVLVFVLVEVFDFFAKRGTYAERAP